MVANAYFLDQKVIQDLSLIWLLQVLLLQFLTLLTGDNKSTCHELS